MKTHQILGMIWLVLCGYFGFSILRHVHQLYSADRLGDTATWAVCLVMVMCLLYFVGVVVSVFLIRGKLWARRFIGLIAAFSLLGCVGRLIALGSLGPWLCLVSIFSLVSVIILFYPKRYAV